MTYSTRDLMDFEVVPVTRLYEPGEPPRMAVQCTLCHQLVVEDLGDPLRQFVDDVVRPCVEHRRSGCPKSEK